jgi:hypothetical protein
MIATVERRGIWMWAFLYGVEGWHFCRDESEEDVSCPEIETTIGKFKNIKRNLSNKLLSQVLRLHGLQS